MNRLCMRVGLCVHSNSLHLTFSYSISFDCAWKTNWNEYTATQDAHCILCARVLAQRRSIRMNERAKMDLCTGSSGRKWAIKNNRTKSSKNWENCVRFRAMPLISPFFRCVTIVNVHIILKCLKIVKCSVMLRVSGLRWINTTLEHSTRFTSVFGVFENLP